MKAKILMFVILLSMSAALIAQPVNSGEKKQVWEPDRVLLDENRSGPMDRLNLTDEQKESFKQGMMSLQKELKPLRNELGELNARQKTLESADQPDFKSINKNLDKIGELKTEMAKIQVKNRLEMRAQLTDEQRMKFDMVKRKIKHMRGNMNREIQRDRRN